MGMDSGRIRRKRSTIRLRCAIRSDSRASTCMTCGRCEIVQTPKKVLMVYENDQVWRDIWTDGRDFPKTIRAALVRLLGRQVDRSDDVCGGDEGAR